MNLNRDQLLSQLRQMDEYEFEQLVADVWEQRGWNTTVTTGSSDRGIDVIAKKSSPFHQKHLIQVKRYSAGNKIGSPDIQQYSSLKKQENDADAVVVVTTSSFSSQAEQAAEDLNVKLINGQELCDTITDSDLRKIVFDYIDEFTDKLAYEYKKILKKASEGSTPRIGIKFNYGDSEGTYLMISIKNQSPFYNIMSLDSKEIIITEYIARERDLSVISKSKNKNGETVILKGNADMSSKVVVEITEQVLSDVYQISEKNKCDIEIET